MTRNDIENKKWIVTFAAAMLVAASANAGAQQLITDAQIHALMIQAAQQTGGSPQTGATPGQPPDTLATDTRPVVQLTMDDVVKLTLDRNLSIAVQRITPQTFDFTIASIKSAYRPTASSLLGGQSTVTPPTASIQGLPPGASGVTSGVTTFNGGLSQNVPWGGGALALSLTNTRNTSTSTTALYSPDYLPTYTAQYTQPLLRGRSIDGNRQTLAVTRLDQNISESQLKATITNTLSNAREAYWNFVYTVQAVEVAQQALDAAQELVRENQARLGVGIMAQLDVVTAQSQAAQAQQALVQAQANRIASEISLKQFIVSGTDDPNWNVRIDPVDRPDFHPETPDVEAALRRALSARTDLEQAQLNERANDVTLRFLKNQLLPQADLVARYGFAGLGGTEFERANGIVVGTIPGGFGDSLTSLNEFPQWNVSLTFSAPIGTNVASAAVAQARVQQSQVVAQVHQIELQVAVDVTNAATNIRSATEVVQAAQQAQVLAQQTYEAEQAKFNVGLSTNYNVILLLNTLNSVKNSYLQAVRNYNNALVEFDRLQQTTLTSLGITVLSSATLGAPGAIGSAR
jgi:outer membrane protein